MSLSEKRVFFLKNIWMNELLCMGSYVNYINFTTSIFIPHKYIFCHTFATKRHSDVHKVHFTSRFSISMCDAICLTAGASLKRFVIQQFSVTPGNSQQEARNKSSYGGGPFLKFWPQVEFSAVAGHSEINKSR